MSYNIIGNNLFSIILLYQGFLIISRISFSSRQLFLPQPFERKCYIETKHYFSVFIFYKEFYTNNVNEESSCV